MDNPYTSPTTASDLPKATQASWKMKILELQPVDSDAWRVLWEDIAVGECQINIEPSAAGPAKTTPQKID